MAYYCCLLTFFFLFAHLLFAAVANDAPTALEKLVQQWELGLTQGQPNAKRSDREGPLEGLQMIAITIANHSHLWSLSLF